MKNGWKKFFDATSEFYDKLFHAYTLGYNNIVIDVVKDNLSDASLILDLCSGTGACGSKFNCSVIALDHSLNMLKTAGKIGRRLKCVVGDALNLPFKNSVFDGVAMTFAIHGMFPEERKRCIYEIRRVLKDGGKVAIGDHGDTKDVLISAHLKSFNYDYRDVIKDLKSSKFRVKVYSISEEYVVMVGKKL